MWIVIGAFLFFASINCDDTVFHLHNYLNNSISPCSDFYSHVCSTEMNYNESASYKSAKFYRKLAAQLDSRSRNNPIMNDIASARENEWCTFDALTYAYTLEQRCGSRFDCYLEEFYYFYNAYTRMVDEVDDMLIFFAWLADITVDIPRIVEITSKMIELMIDVSQDEDLLDDAVAPYETLHDRLSIMSELQHFNMTNRPGPIRLRNMTNNLITSIRNRFTATPWLNETDVFGLDRLSQFLTTLDEITITGDFEDLDSNLQFMRKIDRMVSAKYFEYSKISTGCEQFDVIHPFIWAKSEMGNKVETLEDERIASLIEFGLDFNAFNDANSIMLLAPSFFLILRGNSSEITLLALSETIGHEIFHSFIKNDLMHWNEVFRAEANCVINNFNRSCNVWDENNCNSGEQTFEEDGPDVEGLRAATDLLRTTYSEEELKELEYEDLGITRAQAFFYAYGVRACTGYEHDPENEHSSARVRVNAAVSLIPEFSAAFACQRGDKEYSDESSTCNLFGPRSGMAKEAEPNEEFDGNTEEQESPGSGVEEPPETY